MHEAMCNEAFPKANRACRTCKHRKGCRDRGEYVGDAGCSDYEGMGGASRPFKEVEEE